LLTLVVGLSLAELATRLLDCSPLGCGSGGHVVELTRGRSEGQAVHKLLLKVCEALVAQKVVLGRECTEIGALALVANVLCGFGGKVDQASEVVFAVKLEQGLEGRQTSKGKSLSRLKALDLGSLTLENDLVLLVAGAECDNGEFGSSRDSQIAGVAEVVLSFRERCARKW